MLRDTLIAALLAVLPALSLADVSLPDTPAGHALRAWLDAFNSGDRATYETFEKAHAPWLELDEEMQSRERTGGYDLLDISESDRLWIVFRAKERTSSVETVGRLIVRSYDPDHITLLSLESPGESSARIAVDEGERRRVIDGAVKLLNQFYVFPDVAEKVSAKLRAGQKRGAYRNITDAETFAIRLSDDLVALSGDRHIAVDFFTEVIPDEPPPSRPHPDPRLLAARNCGFEKADHYSPNIGYLKLNWFDEPEYCAPTAMAAMNFLADSDALIVDLRENHGGAPQMSALVSSYLFDERTHLDDIYDRRQNSTEQLWTFPHLPGKKLAAKPIFVLTSARTFSAGELFTYDLKALKRATLIGETTGGGAHLMSPHRIDDHFVMRVPFGRLINPVTKTDWEGTGIEPDMKVAADQALDVALKLAAEAISKNAVAADATELRPGHTFRECAECPEMVVVPSGTFVMGAPPDEPRAPWFAPEKRGSPADPESPQHKVTLRAFALGKFDVTRAQWAAFSAATHRPITGGCEWSGFPPEEASLAAASWRNLGFTQDDNHPVVCVSWNDAQAYLRWLTERTGQPYRLPTEAEWEYAARAGSTSAYPWGETASHDHANYGSDQCCKEMAEGRDQWLHTSPVGSFPPNAFGLFDMHGNAWQWVQDCYADTYAAAPTDGSRYDESDCQRRVLRGGTWGDPPGLVRSATRNWAPPPPSRWNPQWEYRSGGVGFRVARDIQPARR